MNDDTRQLIYSTITLFLVVVVLWLGLVYVSACGFTLNCVRGAPLVVRTPIPTLIPMAHSDGQMEPAAGPGDFNKCQVAATDLIGAWVAAGYAETEAFPFTDVTGRNCEATFADIQPLLTENSVWFPGSLGCTSCHNADLTERSAGLDLSTYQAISLGTRRVAESTSPGTDIFGGGDWKGSLLYEALVNQGLTTLGHSAEVEPRIPLLYAGQAVTASVEAEATATPTP